MRLRAIASAFRFDGIRELPIVNGHGGSSNTTAGLSLKQPLEMGECKPHELKVESPIDTDIYIYRSDQIRGPVMYLYHSHLHCSTLTFT